MNPAILYESQLVWTLLLVLLAVAGVGATTWREKATRRARRPLRRG